MRFLLNSIFIITFAVLLQSCFDGTNDPTIDDPNRPNNPSPENSATDQNLVVTLEWQYDEANIFDVYFDTKNPPEEQYVGNLERKRIIVAGLQSGETYYWRVVAKPDGGSSVEGPVWSFRTKTRGGVSGPGFVMIKHNLSTEIPNFVNVLFQVLDLDGNGVTDFSTIDFNLFEDGVLVDHQEVDLAVTKREDNNFVHRTVLMLDNSTSLTTVDLDEIKQASIQFVRSLADSHQVAIYQFSQDPELLVDFTDDKTLLENTIANDYVSGFATTNLYGTVIEGAGRMTDFVSTDRVVQSSMILFTDGMDTQGSSSLESALDAIEDKTVYTVGLGIDIDPDVLELIGNKGFFSIAEARAGDLIDVFDEINDNIFKLANSFYWLRYNTPKRGNADHTVRLEIIGNPVNSFIEDEFNSSPFYSVEPGIYIEPTKDRPQGITNLTIPAGLSKQIKAYVMGSSNEPSITWEEVSDPSNLIFITPVQNTNNSEIVIQASATNGQAVIRAIDNANGFVSPDLTILIQ